MDNSSLMPSRLQVTGRIATLGENPRPAQKFPAAGFAQVFGDVSQGRRWGSDGACLEYVSGFSHDPIAADINLYRYVNNDPLDATDPTGLEACCALVGGTVVAGGGATVCAAGACVVVCPYAAYKVAPYTSVPLAVGCVNLGNWIGNQFCHEMTSQQMCQEMKERYEKELADKETQIAEQERKIESIKEESLKQKKGGGLRYDWSKSEKVLAKLLEEAAELKQAIKNVCK